MRYGRSIASRLLANCLSISCLEHLVNVNTAALTRLIIYLFDCFNVFFNLFVDMFLMENGPHHQQAVS